LPLKKVSGSVPATGAKFGGTAAQKTAKGDHGEDKGPAARESVKYITGEKRIMERGGKYSCTVSRLTGPEKKKPKRSHVNNAKGCKVDAINPSGKEGNQ